MSTAQVIPFIKPSQPPQEADMSTNLKDSGYTPLPNYLVDDDFIANMTGNALKCYVVINRYTKGFNRSNWAIESKYMHKKTDIKKPHTLFDAVKQLENLGLVSVHREDGKTNKFTITNPCLKTALPINGTTAENGHKSSAKKGHSTTAENGHTKKENFKDKFKEIKKTDVLVDKSKTEMFSESIEYHGKDKTEYGLRELVGVYTIQSDFMNQAKQINPKLDDEKIMSELKNFAQWSTSQNKTTAQGWMNFWIYRIKNLKTSKPRNSQVTKTENTKPKALSDAQISWFSSELCNYGPFSSRFANMGEKPKEFISRITANLRKPEHVKTYAPYLNELGFVVSVEEFHAE